MIYIKIVHLRYSVEECLIPFKQKKQQVAVKVEKRLAV